MKGTDAGPPWQIIPSRITLKPAAGKRFLCGSACQLHSATPAEWLAFCVFFFFINETQRFGLLLPLKLFGSVGAGLSFGEPMWPTIDPTLSKDFARQMSGSFGHTNEAPRTWQPAKALHSLLSLFNTVCCSWFFFLRVWKVCLFHYVGFLWAPPISPLWVRHWGHRVQRWAGFRVQRSLSTFLSTFSQTAPLFFTSCLVRAAPCLGYSFTWPCQSHSFDIVLVL